MILDETKNLLIIGPIGSRDGHTTFVKSDDAVIYVTCGCFHGTIDEFNKAVLKTHDECSIHRNQYLNAIEYVRKMFNN